MRLLALIACCLVAAGCGDGNVDSVSTIEGLDEESAESAPAKKRATGTPPKAKAPEAPTRAPAAGGISERDSPAPGGLAATCKDQVEDAQLVGAVRSDLEKACETAASRQRAEVEETSADICKRIEETVPAGSAREQALDACEEVQEQLRSPG